MRKEDALKILQAKLVEIEQEHDSELAESEGPREPVDAKAEARALSAVFRLLSELQADADRIPASCVQALFARAEDADADRGRRAHPAVESELRLGRSLFGARIG
jgi:hypothetical protein